MWLNDSSNLCDRRANRETCRQVTEYSRGQPELAIAAALLAQMQSEGDSTSVE